MRSLLKKDLRVMLIHIKTPCINFPVIAVQRAGKRATVIEQEKGAKLKTKTKYSKQKKNDVQSLNTFSK